LAPPLH
jgi:hypothetical protein